MTLDTRMYVHDEVDVHTFFHRFRELLGAGPEHPYRDEPTKWGAPGEWSIGNHLGIGLPALVSINYRPGEALRAVTTYCDCSENVACETRCSKAPAYAEVSMDTAYGYRDDDGRNAGDLHAYYVAQLGQWLDERGISWSWKNEFTGEIHGGEDRYERLTDITAQHVDDDPERSMQEDAVCW